MKSDSDVVRVLNPFGPQAQPSRIQFLGNAGGFSGARIWRLTTRRGDLCLRQWPSEHPDRRRLQQIHAVLLHVFKSGFQKVPAPLATDHGETMVHHAGCLWELTLWLPGTADFHQNPKPERLRAAMQALAEFHRAAATLPSQRSESGPSLGLSKRRQQIHALQSGDLPQLASAVQGKHDLSTHDLTVQAQRILELFSRHVREVESQVDSARHIVAPLQPCIRDIWHDHVLYDGDAVSGIIDFGAMRVETVAGDIARLLGSLVGDDALQWQAGIECYAAHRPLTNDERNLVDVFDRSTVLLSGMNWLRWIYLEGKRFPQYDKIKVRLDDNIRRLECLS